MVAVKGVSRRIFVADGARAAGVATLGVGMLGLVVGCQSSNVVSTPEPKSAAQAVQEWPWPYVQLDPQAVAQKAYESYYDGGCMYGTFNAIVGALSGKVGYPYTVIPTQMAKYGEGGAVGWATLCGALNGAAAAMNLVSKDFRDVVNELIGWYTKTSFTSFKPASPKVNIQATSVSGSPLCHVSVTEWCKAAGAKAESPERAERCARLTADVSAQAVELLNKYVAGDFKATFALSTSVGECGACHLKGGTLENARGKMDCVECHEPHLGKKQ